MSQDSRGNAHGLGRAASALSGAGASGDAVLSRELGELTNEIRHLARGIDTLNSKLERHDQTLIKHAERLVRLEQGPTRGDLVAATREFAEADRELGTRLTVSERKIAVVIAVALVAGTVVQIALNAAKLLQGAGS